MEIRYRNKNKLQTIDYSNSTSIFLGLAILFFAFITVTVINDHAYYAFAQNETSNTEKFFSLPNHIIVGKPIPGQFIVTVTNETMFKESLPALSDASEESGLKVVNTFSNLGILVVNGSEDSVPALSDMAEQNDTGIIIEANRIVGILGQSLPTGIDRIDAESPSTTPTAMSTNKTSMSNLNDVNIGIIDTGVDLRMKSSM